MSETMLIQQRKEHPVRSKLEKYPDYTAEIEALEAGGITDKLLQRIIEKHRYNSTTS